MGGGDPCDVSYTGWGLTAMTRITVPRDGLCEEISSAAVWAGEAGVNADGAYFWVVRHKGEQRFDVTGKRSFVCWLGRRGRSGIRKRKSALVGDRSRRKRDGTGNGRWLQREMEWCVHEAALERGHLRSMRGGHATEQARPNKRLGWALAIETLVDKISNETRWVW